MRVVSLLPAATEIVAALGFTDALVGISHDCNYPPEVTDRPRVTHCEIHGKNLASAAVDGWVAETLAKAGTLYTLDEALLRTLEPDVIVTQQLCEVCAVDYASVMTIANALSHRPKVVNLAPSSLADVMTDIRRVAGALGAWQRGEQLIERLEARIDVVRSLTSATSERPRCFVMEWIEPLYCSGHWTPELVELAGGCDPLGRKNAFSVKVSWDAVSAADPEVIVLAICGYDIERTLSELHLLESNVAWRKLRAVRQGNVHVVDGNAYFSRPGPRLIDSLEILAQLLHPRLFSGRYPQRAVMRLAALSPA